MTWHLWNIIIIVSLFAVPLSMGMIDNIRKEWKWGKVSKERNMKIMSYSDFPTVL